jgi:hypothetical protein
VAPENCTGCNLLALGQLAAVEGQGPVLAADRAGPATIGAGLLGPQPVGLLAEQDVEGAFGEARVGRLCSSAVALLVFACPAY